MEHSKRFNIVCDADVSIGFQLWDLWWSESCGMTCTRVSYPLRRGRWRWRWQWPWWRIEDSASWGYYFPLDNQLMLICHTWPKNVKYEGGKGVFKVSSRAAHIYKHTHVLVLTRSQQQWPHMCTLAQKYWGINSSQASGGGSCANSAALTYSKRVSSLA